MLLDRQDLEAEPVPKKLLPPRHLSGHHIESHLPRGNGVPQVRFTLLPAAIGDCTSSENCYFPIAIGL